MEDILRESGPTDRFLRNLLWSQETKTEIEEWDFQKLWKKFVEMVSKLTGMMFWLVFTLATLECENLYFTYRTGLL